MNRYMNIIVALAVIMMLFSPAIVASEQTEPVAPKEKILLFNGKDLTVWKPYASDTQADLAKTWSVKEGVISCEGNPAGYMRTEKD